MQRIAETLTHKFSAKITTDYTRFGWAYIREGKQYFYYRRLVNTSISAEKALLVQCKECYMKCLTYGLIRWMLMCVQQNFIFSSKNSS